VADPKPTDFSAPPTINQWGGVQVPKENSVYDFLDQVKQTTDPAFTLINTGLGILESILDFVSSLLIDISQPIKLAIDALIALLEGLIRDLKSAGIYFTWDYDLFSDPLLGLRGGYPAFETRTSQKLLDRKDLSRPDFSSNTSVFGLAFFGGADTSGINRLIKTLTDLFGLFGVSPQQNSLRAPSSVNAKYYQKFGVAHTELNPASIDLDNKPSGIRLTWEYPSVNLTGVASPPPLFIVSVKTTTKKQTIHFKVAQTSSTSSPTELYEGVLQDPADVRLDASSDLLGILDIPVGSGVNKVYLRDQDGNITDSLDTYHQTHRTYFIQPQSVLGQLFGPTSYAIDIPFEALPTEGDGGYVVSVRSCTETTLLEADLRDLEGDNAYDGKCATRLLKADLKPVKRINITPNNLSLPSNSVSIPKVDSDTKLLYVSALREALSLFVLCRLDKKEARDFLGLQTSEYQARQIAKFFSVGLLSNDNKIQTTKSLKDAIDRAIGELVPASPSDSLLVGIKAHIDALNNKNKDHIPFYSFMSNALTSGSTADGIGRKSGLEQFYKDNNTSYVGELESNLQNQVVLGVPIVERTTEQTVGALSVDLAPPNKAVVKVTDIRGLESAPIVYCSNGTLREFVRNPITPTQFYARAVAQTQGVAPLCESALAVLSIVVPKEKPVGQWLNLRLGDFVGLSGVIDVLDDLNDYASALSAGLAGIVETIKKYIAQIKNRIAEIQRILSRIKAVLDAILSFRFPAGLYVLPFTGNGTTDATNAFLSAKNKPNIVGGYGAGGMIVLGGLPSLLVDFFIAIIGGE